jgi:CHAT domain-containing protein
MSDLYRRWVQGAGKVTKAEALRQAQLDLLKESIRPKSYTTNRSIRPEKYYIDQITSFAHPYYWAPFVLTGNWK